MANVFEPVSSAAVYYSSTFNQFLWSFVLTPEQLKNDCIYHHSTAAPLTWPQLNWTMGMYYVSVFVAVIIADFLISRPLTFLFLKACGKSTNKMSRTSWLLLHALFNTFVTFASVFEAAQVLADPTGMSFNPPRWWGSQPGALVGVIAIGAFHLHHFVFFEFTFEDVVHHLVNAGAVVVVGVLCPWGRLTALSNFAMCAVPGGLNYYALWLRKGDVISTGAQKQLNRFLNIVLRYPIQLIVAYIFFVVFQQPSFPECHWFTVCLMLFGVIAHTSNSLYYADQVVGNYWIFKTQARAQPEPMSPMSMTASRSHDKPKKKQ